jgi:hypothetical protein
MRLLIPALLAFALTAPAMADTLQVVTTKGVIMEIQGEPTEIFFKADGAFTSTGGPSGTWKIDGDKLCWSSPGLTENTCDVYPKGKTSGDSFLLNNDVLGLFKVTLK